MSADLHEQPPKAPSAVDMVFEALIKDILEGAYGAAGARLPAERELARALGASRATLRDALRRLTEWGVVEPRRGSGVIVRAARDWSIEVLPAYLRYAAPQGNAGDFVRLLDNLLGLRRVVMEGMVELSAQRLSPGSLDGAREALDRAWAARDEAASFTTRDFEMFRTVVEAADMLPAQWVLNRTAGIYLEVARAMVGGLPPVDDYHDVHCQLFDLMENGQGARARTLLSGYLRRHDERLLSALEAWT